MTHAIAWIGIDSQVWHAFRTTSEAHGQQPRVLLEAFMTALVVGWGQELGLLDATQQAQLDALIAHGQEQARLHAEGR